MLLRGHIHWALLDKRRPALIVSTNYRNERASDVIAIPISTTFTPSGYHVPLQRGEAGLRSRSVALCEQIITIDRERIEPTALGGPVSRERMREVEAAILRAIGIAVE